MNIETTEILTPDHPKWETFAEALAKALDEHGCDGQSLRLAVPIMSKMDNIDVPATVEYFENHGGYCDCEIFLNVGPDPSFWDSQALRERMTGERKWISLRDLGEILKPKH